MKQMNIKIDGALGRKLEHEKRLETAKPNSIAVLHDELLPEWDWEKNDALGLDPYQVTCGSGKKVNWICLVCGNKYMAYPYRRTKGSGCNECAKKAKGIHRHGKLADEFPAIAAEWHPTLNETLTPRDVTSGSERKVWWKCSKYGHSYQMMVKSRTTLRQDCPVCAGKQVCAGFNDLETVYPDIAAKWHPTLNGDLKPNQVTYGSQKKVWWICCDHDEPFAWEASIKNVAGNGSGCPICGRNRITASHEKPAEGESLAEVSPRIAAEWDYEKNGELTPCDVKSKSAKRVHWICAECGNEWMAAIASRVRQDSGCAVCAGKQLLTGVNDLETLYPDIAAEWHPTKNGDLVPSQITAHNKKVVWWLGSCGHEWPATVGNRTYGAGCPRCNEQCSTSFPEKAVYFYVSKAFTDAQANAHPDIDGIGRMELDIWIPSKMTAVEYDGEYWHTDGERDAKKDSVCRDNNITLIRIREPNCPDYGYDSSRVIVRESATTSESLNKAIVELLSKLNGKADVIVDVDADEQAIMSTMASSQIENSFGVKFPNIAAEWAYDKNEGLTPYMFKPFSARSVWWSCPNGHEDYQAKIMARSCGSGCPVCAREKRADSLSKPRAGNSLAEFSPEIAAEWNYEKNGNITPADVNRGSCRKVWWICPNSPEHDYYSAIADRTSRGSGCPICGYKIVAEKKRQWWAIQKMPSGTQLQLNLSA